MKNRLVIACISTLLVGSAAAQIPADMPKPDPGLWQMQTSIVQMGGMGMGYRVCIGDEVDDLLMQPEENVECREFSYRRDGDRLIYNATCDADGSEARVEGVFTGDIRRNYQGNIATTFTPPLEGIARTDMTLNAQWIGPCAPGQQSGDVVIDSMPSLPGMGEIDLDAIMKQLEQMQRR